MKKAISIWNNRIAPVFDESQECIIIEEDYSKSEVQKLPLGLEDKIQFLLDNEVSTLICGAISRFAENQLLQNNIDVSPFVAGSVNEVISALEEESSIQKFAMPVVLAPLFAVVLVWEEAWAAELSRSGAGLGTDEALAWGWALAGRDLAEGSA